MSLFITSLNSGSNGNCYYIGNEYEAVLIDAGISCREIEMRMNGLGLNIKKVKAIFVSHEHSDHIKGIATLCKKFNFPVYITNATLASARIKIDKTLIHAFSGNEPVNVGNLTVTGFSKFHDAADPYSFVVSCKNITVGVFTDIGNACKNVVEYFKVMSCCFSGSKL